MSSSSPAISHHKPTALDIASNTINWIDKEAIDSVKVAVEAATVVWRMTDGLLAEDATIGPEFTRNLTKAKDITQRLAESILLLGSGDASEDKTPVRNEAHSFANVSPGLIQLSPDFANGTTL